MYKFLPILLFAYGLALTTDDIYDNSYALIIGIDKYENVSNLDYAVKDANSIASLLKDNFNFPSKTVTVLLNEEATFTNIRNGLSKVSSSAKANDRVLIYFAGHGMTDDLPDGGEMGYLLPIEAKRDELFTTSIPMDDLKRISSMSKSKHMLFLIDACYGGLAATGARGLSSTTPNYIDKITKDKSRQIITAGGRGEQVIEKSEWGHSAFTLNLIRALEDGKADLNDDGYITAEELGLFLKEKVSIDSDNQQTPVSRRFTSQEGEFIFISKADNVTLSNNEKVVINEASIDYDVLAKKLAEELKQQNNSIAENDLDEHNSTVKILIHITSLKEQIGKYEGNHYEFIKGNKLTSLKLDKLNLIRENIESMLLGEFIDTPYELIIPHSSNQLKFLDENHILDFSDTSFLHVSINYKRFNKPTKIHFINIYEIQEEQKNKTPKYFYREMSWKNMPDTGNNWSKVDTTSELITIEEVILNNFKEYYRNSGLVAVVKSVEDGLIYIKLTNLKIKKNMVLLGVPFYDYKKNGRRLRVEDLNNAINYFNNSTDSVSQAKVNNYKKELKSIEKGTGFNWYGNNTRRFSAPIDFEYRLKVIDILSDSVAVAEVTKLDFPFVIIRDGDLLEID